MALREIRTAGDPVLRQVAKPVEKFEGYLHTLLDDMIETMYEADGVGLAAPQIGISKRIVVIDVGDGPIELINPRIISAEGEELDVEGCLSVPSVRGEVKRAAKVTAEGFNRRGEKVEITGEGLLARALQHELDHLDGILFIDKVIRFVKDNKKEEK